MPRYIGEATVKAVLSLLFLSLTCFAQMRNMAVDESNALKNVKKVAVFINLGPASPAPYQPDFERAKKQMAKKLVEQKLELVPDAKDADLVLVVESSMSTPELLGRRTHTAVRQPPQFATEFV